MKRTATAKTAAGSNPIAIPAGMAPLSSLIGDIDSSATVNHSNQLDTSAPESGETVSGNNVLCEKSTAGDRSETNKCTYPILMIQTSRKIKGSAMKRSDYVKFKNISSLQTTLSKRKVLEILEEMDWDSLFLNLPSDWESALEALRHGFDFDDVVEEMRTMDQVRLPEDAHLLNTWRPLLEGLTGFTDRKVRCIRDPIIFMEERQIAIDLALLSFRARLGRIDLNKWKEVLEEEMWLARREAVIETERLVEDADGVSVCVDLSHHTEERLERMGYKIEKINLGTRSLPLEKLKSELLALQKQNEGVPESLLIKRIREHLAFVDKLISGKGFDEVLNSWVFSNGKNGS